MLDASGWAAVRLTLQLAALTTAILVVLVTPLAWWIARGRARLHRWLAVPARSLITLPLVLPPTVLGFYLLVAMGSSGPLGRLTQALGWGTLAFTFTGLLIGSVIYSLPFVAQPIIDAFESLGERPLEAAATLRAGPLDAFWHVALPMARQGYLTGSVLGFAHTLGEFGVVLMIGGNIPRQTRTISVQVFDSVEALEYTQAHWLSAGMLAFAFAVLLALHFVQARSKRKAD
ncbi:MAG: molybdate ABC transporter permease subunit [Ottowia sp.]|nr:molybdate ABC transporter permease subunit [Ottowia sp.]